MALRFNAIRDISICWQNSSQSARQNGFSRPQSWSWETATVNFFSTGCVMIKSFPKQESLTLSIDRLRRRLLFRIANSRRQRRGTLGQLTSNRSLPIFSLQTTWLPRLLELVVKQNVREELQNFCPHSNQKYLRISFSSDQRCHGPLAKWYLETELVTAFKLLQSVVPFYCGKPHDFLCP